VQLMPMAYSLKRCEARRGSEGSSNTRSIHVTCWPAGRPVTSRTAPEDGHHLSHGLRRGPIALIPTALVIGSWVCVPFGLSDLAV
jgi:hypothetical protein